MCEFERPVMKGMTSILGTKERPDEQGAVGSRLTNSFPAKASGYRRSNSIVKFYNSLAAFNGIEHQSFQVCQFRGRNYLDVRCEPNLKEAADDRE